MFERYTEKARRIIFFGRYEASQFGCPYIETEHLLLGLLREDKALAIRFLHSSAAIDYIRKLIEAHTPVRESVTNSVDLPLSQECKRVLAYCAEEAEQLNHQHISTSHLLIGLLREDQFYAAQLLREQGLTLDSVRQELQQSKPQIPKPGSSLIASLDRWLAEREARGGIWSLKHRRIANGTTLFTIYAGEPRNEINTSTNRNTTEQLEQIQKRLDSIIDGMQHALADHEPDKAQYYLNEERKES